VSGRERGYALLLAVAVVAVLSLAVLAAARVQGDAAAATARLSERNAEVIGAESLMNRVAFLMATEPADGRALMIGGAQRWDGATLRLDGAWYRVDGIDGAAIAVQDEAGLIDLNAADPQALAALLVYAGVGVRSDTLAAALLDFVDEDDLVRDGGAEARDYERLGLPPPPDRALASRWQALNALGWREQRLDRIAIWGWLGTGSVDAGLNINTAPAPVLEAMLGDRRRVDAILRRRESAAINDVAEAELLTSDPERVGGVSFAVTTGRVFRVQAVFGSQRSRHGIERRLELGGEAATQPFRWIEEREVRSAPLRDGESVISLSLDAPAS
jgi:type II secretory pathway component PulK